ncbi:MAG: metalloregulator ArsR/SmtB family transcription factor [Patescibacteria group bacterium]
MNKRIVNIFKALADETRVDILRRLSHKKELSCQELAGSFSLSQPTLSHHFNKLISANILSARKEGSSHIYSINSQFLKTVGINIQKIVAHNA